MPILSRAALLLAVAPVAAAVVVAGAGGAARSVAESRHLKGNLLQTWGQALAGDRLADGVKDTPVTRVVSLLEEMQKTLQTEMDEDAALYEKLFCWCKENKYNKATAISDAEAKITDLKSSIEALTAKEGDLKATIKQLEDDVATEKQALATATELREKEAAKFHGEEVDSIQSIETLKAAILVLGRHHGVAPAALPQLSLLSVHRSGDGASATASSAGGSRGSGGDAGAGDQGPWDAQHESSLSRTFDDFMEQHGFASGADADSVDAERGQRLLQESGAATAGASVASDASSGLGWTADETATVEKAMKAASVFMQAKHAEDYAPQSGEIMGVMKELMDEMQADLSEAQKTEMAAAAAFAELRASKTKVIEAGEANAEKKEDELAQASMDLAEAKEDLGQTEATLTADQKFMITLKATCEDADTKFEERKSTRMEEIKAVSEAMQILTADEARDTTSRTYSLLQLRTRRRRMTGRREAAAVLRKVAKKVGSPDLSILATRVELDAFDRVKKAIDDMVATLTTQQADEVKKNDWCKSEIQANEMATARMETKKTDLSTQVDDVVSTLTTLTSELKEAQARIADLSLQLQRATEDRMKENLEFQKTVADQQATQEMLTKALARLQDFYNKKEDFVQLGKAGHQQAAQKDQRQTPPVPQIEYKKNAGASGVMQMLAKLIHEAKDMEKSVTDGEATAQAQYEALVGDTNASISALQREVAFKTGAKAEADHTKIQLTGDLSDTEKELEELGAYNADLHGECDYILKNFNLRQDARMQEIESLKQAKQILSGANLS